LLALLGVNPPVADPCTWYHLTPTLSVEATQDKPTM